MDLAKIAELLGSKTEGDPGFQDTEESQFFVHLLRMEDVDNRAVAVRQPPDASEEPGASDQQVQEIKESADLLTSSGDDTVAEPAATESANVAPEAEPSQALFSEGPDPVATQQETQAGPEAQPAEVFMEVGPEPQSAESRADVGTDAQAVDLFQEDGPEATESIQQRDDGQDAVPVVQDREDTPEAQVPDVLTEAGLDAEAATQTPVDGEQAVAPEVFQQEGPEVQPATQSPPEEFLEISTQSARGETTMVVPESLMEAGFMDVMRRFDATVRMPDIQVGEVPPASMMEELQAESVQSSTEGAEQMLTGLSRNMVQWERRV